MLKNIYMMLDTRLWLLVPDASFRDQVPAILHLVPISIVSS